MFAKKQTSLTIAIFTDSFIPQVNGVVTSIITMTKILADRGHVIHIVAPAYADLDEYAYPGITVHRVPSIPAGFYPDFRWTSVWNRKISTMISRENIDVIHIHTPSTVSMMGILLGKKYHIPVVGTFHTFITDPHYFKQLFRSTHAFFYWLAKKIAHLFYNRPDLVTSPSPSTNRELDRLEVVPPKKYISNGIDLDKFDNGKSKAVRKKYGLKGKTVLYVGRVSHEKNFQVLIDSFFMVHEQMPDAKMIIVGHGPIWDDVSAQIKTRQCEDAIIMTGSIPYDELIVSGIFGAVELFATASVTENQPMTILEAQANGLVCVGPDARGIPDLIVHEVNGLVAPPNDAAAMARAMVTLLTNEKLYERYKKATIKSIKDHDIFTVAQVWETTYRDLIEKKGLEMNHG